MREFAAFGLLAVLTVACTTTHQVKPEALGALRDAEHTEAVEIVDEEGRRLRVDPNTSLRFKLTDESYTPWIRANQLRTGPLGVRAGDEGWAWESIALAEVRNFSGPKTFALVIGGTVIAATVIAVAVASKGDCCDGAGLFLAGTAVRAGETAAVVGQAQSPEPPAPEEGAVSTQTGEGSPLFVGAIRRRSVVTVAPYTQFMLPLEDTRWAEQTVGAAFRFFDVWEVAGFARATGLPSRDGLHFIGGARLGLHLELDRHHRFSIPIRLEMGGGPHVASQTRLGLGLRVRVTDGLRLGVHAPSPTLTVARREVDERRTYWTFPAGLDVAYAF